MTCLGCDSTGYRKLCNYDDEHNTCGGGDHPILGQSSYKCVEKGYGSNQNQCVHVNQAPGPGRFTTMQECQQNCSTPRPLQSKSYKCVGTGYGGNNRQCVKINALPGTGRYPSIQECQSHCGGGNVGSSYISGVY